MPVDHSFVDPKADGADATIVRPSNWNADHLGSPDLPSTLYDPAVDETLAANGTAVLDTDALILDSGRLLTIPSNSLLWMNAPRLRQQVTEFNVRDYGAVGDGVADDTNACQSALNAASVLGGDVIMPVGTYKWTSPVTMNSGVRLIGVGGTNWWGRNAGTIAYPVKVNYSGITAALQVKTQSGGHIRNVKVRNIHFDGLAATGAVDGCQIDATAANSDIVGVFFEECHFSNFPRSQVVQLALPAGSAAWGITFDRCGFIDGDRAGTGHLVDFQGPTTLVSEVTFFTCIWVGYSNSGLWCLKSLSSSTRLQGGTVNPGGVVNCNGAWMSGYSSVVGTHFEGGGNASTFAARVSGSGGHVFQPTTCITWGTGLEIGDPAVPAAYSAAFVTGFYSGNVTRDIHIVAGGSRVGTILAMQTSVAATVLDDHAVSDGVYEILRLYGGRIIFPVGTAALPALADAAYTTTGWYVEQATGDLCWAIAGTLRMRMPAATVTMQICAQLYPGSGVTANVVQTNAGILGGSGLPNDAVGNNGDFYLRSDMRPGTGISQRIGGIWTPMFIYTSCTADFTGTNVTTAQPVFNTTEDTFTAQALTTYIFEGIYHIHTTGTASHTFGVLFGGAATLTSIDYAASVTNAATEVLGAEQTIWFTAATINILTAATATATHHTVRLKGIVRINAAGTFIPQYQWGTTAPGVAGVTLRNSYFSMIPVGVNTTAAVGQWA